MVKKDIEYEARMLLKKKDFILLIQAYAVFDYKDLKILNLYYDTEDNILIPNGHLVRIRNTNDNEFELTLKISNPNGNIEHNVRLTKQQYLEYTKGKYLVLPEEISKELTDFVIPNNELILQCNLSTLRREIEANNYLIVLDHNLYNGIQDYNIELEAKDMNTAKEALKKICQHFSIQYIEHTPSKSSRALASIKKELN